jgi:hypothetical protein
MKAPKSPEENAAERRAAWDRKVAETAAREAGRKETSARKEALHAAAIAAKANTLSAQGLPVRFPTLGIAVLDGAVYVTKGGLHRLGPLVGARAAVRRIPPRLVRKGFMSQVVLGSAPAEKVERVAIAVVAGGSAHKDVVENTWAAGFGSAGGVSAKAEREAQDFNVLVGQARW